MHALTATRYLLVHHPELSPPWHGILGSVAQDSCGIPANRARELVGWDFRYGFPLLHNYAITEGAIIEVCDLTL